MDDLSKRRLEKIKADADAEIAAALAEITAKSPVDITEADAAFLRARSAYLTPDQRVTFADALRGPEASEADAAQPAEEQPDAAPKKKAK
jgi:hypothetical protein